MEILIDTPRLQMRHFTLEDAKAVFEFSACERTSKYTGDAGKVASIEDAEYIIENVWLAEYKKFGFGRYALIHKGDNKVIGFSGIKYITEYGCPDIGYRMLPQYWGKGLGVETVKATLEYATHVLGEKKIMADVVKDNLASSKILLNCGFKHIDTYQENGTTFFLYEYKK